MAFQLIGSVGWFLARKSVDGVYNNVYHLAFGSKTQKIEHKLDELLEQNKMLKNEINTLKNNNITKDKNKSKNKNKSKSKNKNKNKNKNENIFYNFEVVFVDEYTNNSNNLSKSYPCPKIKAYNLPNNKSANVNNTSDINQTKQDIPKIVSDSDSCSDSDLDYDLDNVQEISVRDYVCHDE